MPCWKGPTRSAVVELECGPEHELVDVQEPDTCKYVMRFVTPSVCNASKVDPALSAVLDREAMEEEQQQQEQQQEQQQQEEEQAAAGQRAAEASSDGSGTSGSVDLEQMEVEVDAKGML